MVVKGAGSMEEPAHATGAVRDRASLLRADGTGLAAEVDAAAGTLRLPSGQPALALVGSRPLESLGKALRRNPRALKGILMASDLLAVCLAMTLASSMRRVWPTQPIQTRVHHLGVSLIFLPVWAAFLAHYRLYSSRHVTSRLFEFRRLVHAAGASIMAIAALSFMVRLRVPRTWLVLTFFTSVVLLTGSREIVRRNFNAFRRRGRLRRPVLVVSANREGRDIVHLLRTGPISGYDVVGFIDDDTPTGHMVDGLPILGAVEDTVQVARSKQIGGVLIAPTALGLQRSSRLAFDLSAAQLHVELGTGLCDVAAERLTVGRIGRLPVLYVEPVRLDGWRGTAKRTFDVTVASLGLLVSLPILIAAIVAIRLDSRGPVLFRQERLGRDGTCFEILKLRTMVPDAESVAFGLRDHNEADGPLFKMRDDPRVTRVGRRLRRLSIDEIPQLWNVLRGEMSLVGPRPALPSEVHGWSSDLHQRLLVRPGITGMWQVSGRASTSFDDYTRLDLYYVHNWSPLTDLAMLAKTVPAVLSRRGAC